MQVRRAPLLSKLQASPGFLQLMVLSIEQARSLLEALSLAWQQNQLAAAHSFLPLQMLRLASGSIFILHEPLEQVALAELLVQDYSGVFDQALIEFRAVMELRRLSLAQIHSFVLQLLTRAEALLSIVQPLQSAAQDL